MAVNPYSQTLLWMQIYNIFPYMTHVWQQKHEDSSFRLPFTLHIFIPGASISNIAFRGMHLKYGGAVVEAENKWNKEQMVEKEQLGVRTVGRKNGWEKERLGVRTDGSKNSWWKRIVIRIEQSIIIRKISPKHLSLCYLMIIFAYTDIIKEEGG